MYDMKTWRIDMEDRIANCPEVKAKKGGWGKYAK